MRVEMQQLTEEELRHGLARTRRPDYATLVPKPPVKYRNIFVLFLKENCIPGFQACIQTKRLSKLWRTLTEDEKKLYADRFRKHEVMYPKRLAAYFENMKQEERFAYCMHKLRRESNIAHRKMREMRRKLGKPLLALRNPFKLFVHDHYTVDGRKRTQEEYEAMLGGESEARNLSGWKKLEGRGRELAKKWNALPEAEKADYKMRHIYLVEQQAEELRQWLEKAPKDSIEEMELLKEMKRMKRMQINTPKKVWAMMADLEKLEIEIGNEGKI